MTTNLLPKELAKMQSAFTPMQEGPVHYCLYARKSSEDDERQALSIDSQIKEMMRVAEKEGLHIVEVRRESHSAKDSGQRPEYNKLIRDIRERKFNGILTWDASRLSRNAGDLASLVDLMDQGILQEIRTHGQRFRNSPNEKFLLMILCSQAKLENDNRGINVVRGLKNKCEMGMRPGVAPIGYINERHVERHKGRVVLDPLRAPIIKEMYLRYTHQRMSGYQLKQWLDTEVDFTTRTGKRIAMSGIYRILNTPFYYGKFEYPEGSGNWYKGSHEPIITKQLYDEAQVRLAENPERANDWGSKDFGFARLIRCGSCGAGVTGEEKWKYRKDGSGGKRYVYYHCTDGKRKDCKEPYINENELMLQLMEIIDQVSIQKIGMREKIEEELERYELFTTGVLGRKETGAKKQVPRISIKKYAKYVLENGTNEEKREVLQHLKSELLLKDRLITLTSSSNDIV